MKAKTTSSRKPTKKRKRKTLLPEKQWAMPAGFHSDDSDVATLRDVVDPNVPTKQLTDLTLEQRAQLVVKRLELQPSLELAMVGAGIVDKDRAIAEVKARTKVGRLLMEIEHQMIRNLMEQAQKRTIRARAQRKTTRKRSR